jgi:hypothetical protein
MQRLTLLLLASFCLFVASGAGPHGEKRNLDRLGWLAGRWANERPLMVMEEVWLPAVGNTMLGVSRVVKSDSLVAHELVIIREHGARFAYEAHPSGQAAATFLSVKVTDSSIIFENLEHDFPQRIGYELVGTDSLYAWVEGPVRGKIKRNEFPYRRTGSPAH